MYKIFIIFQLFCVCTIFVYSIRRTKADSRIMEINTGCLHALQITPKNLIIQLHGCQKPSRTLPVANAEAFVDEICARMKENTTCFRNGYNSFKTCLRAKESHKLYADKIHQYNAGRVHLCENAKKSFIDYEKTGKGCVARRSSDLTKCEELKYYEDWIDLTTIELPPAPTALEKEVPKFNFKECRLKGIWLMCVIGKLDSCKSKSAVNYYKGYYGAMLAATQCDSIMRTDFPALAYAGKLPVYGNANIWRLDLCLFVISLSLLIISM